MSEDKKESDCTSVSFLNDEPIEAESAYTAFIAQNPRAGFVAESPNIIIPYLEKIFAASEKEELLNATARIFLLAASCCTDEEEVKLLFSRWKDETGGLWGSNAPWASCRTELCAFMGKHPRHALALATDAFFPFYQALPNDEKAIYEEVAVKFYDLVDKKVLFYPQTGHEGFKADSISEYFDFELPPKKRIAAIRLLWHGVFISYLPQLNRFFESEEDRKHYLDFRAGDFKPTDGNDKDEQWKWEATVEQRKKETPRQLNTLFLRQSFDAYAKEAFKHARDFKFDFNSKKLGELLVLSAELAAACQPIQPSNVDRSKMKANSAPSFVFTATTETPSNLWDYSPHAFKGMMQAYSDEWHKSDERIAQFEAFQNEFLPLITDQGINYEEALKIIEKHRQIAIEQDAEINKTRNWFKLNRKGHSRYLTLLTHMENKIVTLWATDPRALPEFPKYSKLFAQRLNHAIKACKKQLQADSNSLYNALSGLNKKDIDSVQDCLKQLNQALNDNQFPRHLKTLIQPVKYLLEAHLVELEASLPKVQSPSPSILIETPDPQTDSEMREEREELEVSYRAPTEAEEAKQKATAEQMQKQLGRRVQIVDVIDLEEPRLETTVEPTLAFEGSTSTVNPVDLPLAEREKSFVFSSPLTQPHSVLSAAEMARQQLIQVMRDHPELGLNPNHLISQGDTLIYQVDYEVKKYEKEDQVYYKHAVAQQQACLSSVIFYQLMYKSFELDKKNLVHTHKELDLETMSMSNDHRCDSIWNKNGFASITNQSEIYTDSYQVKLGAEPIKELLNKAINTEKLNALVKINQVAQQLIRDLDPNILIYPDASGQIVICFGEQNRSLYSDSDYEGHKKRVLESEDYNKNCQQAEQLKQQWQAKFGLDSEHIQINNEVSENIAEDLPLPKEQQDEFYLKGSKLPNKISWNIQLKLSPEGVDQIFRKNQACTTNDAKPLM